MSPTEKTFEPVRGARLSQEQVDRYAPRILELDEASEGGLEPGDLVADASSAESPLNDYFEWDDSEAASEWRKEQARYLLRSINVVVVRKGQPYRVRLTHSVVVAEEERRYVSVRTVARTPEYAQQVVAEALRELEAWKQKYGLYKELRGMVRQINSVLREFTKD